MKSYGRWIIFGSIAIGLIALWLLLYSNKKLRTQLEIMLLEKLTKNKIKDLEDKSSAIKIKIDTNDGDIKYLEDEFKELNQAIIGQKESLKGNLENRGLSSDEIASRFNNLNL